MLTPRDIKVTEEDKKHLKNLLQEILERDGRLSDEEWEQLRIKLRQDPIMDFLPTNTLEGQTNSSDLE